MTTRRLTINEGISFLNQLQQRINDLSNMRSQSLYSEHKSFNGEVVERKPEYDVKVIDKKITELQNWKYQLEAKIKTTNAYTEMNLEIPVDELLAPLA